jgi:hypothetical protein
MQSKVLKVVKKEVFSISSSNDFHSSAQQDVHFFETKLILDFKQTNKQTNNAQIQQQL